MLAKFNVGDIVFHNQWELVPRVILAKIISIGRCFYIIDGIMGTGVAIYSNLDSRSLESWINYNYDDSEFCSNIYDYVGKSIMWVEEKYLLVI